MALGWNQILPEFQAKASIHFYVPKISLQSSAPVFHQH